MKKVAVLILALLPGCAAVWNAPYKVEFANSSSITINHDPELTNMGEIQHVAQAHCDKYGKDAVPQTSADKTMWGLQNISFACVKRK